MDRIEELRELYDSIIKGVEPHTIARIVLKDIDDLEKISENIDSHLNKIGELYYNYLELILAPESKHIALRRLKSDFKTFGKESKRIFNPRLSSHQERVQVDILHQAVDTDIQNWRKICLEVDSLFAILTYDYANEDLAKLEFELIGAAPSHKKTKPTKETKLALTQNELMYLFLKLGAKGIFTKTDKIHLARGIEVLSDFSANKTREKGANMDLTELENIKTILDGVSESLNADIIQINETK